VGSLPGSVARGDVPPNFVAAFCRRRSSQEPRIVRNSLKRVTIVHWPLTSVTCQLPWLFFRTIFTTFIVVGCTFSPVTLLVD